MKKVTVLGCGLVGGLIARDLASETELDVLAVDASQSALDASAKTPRVRTQRADLSKRSEIAGVIADADVVVGAVPGRLGFAMLETVIDAGKNVCDISFSPEDMLPLDARARDRGVTAVVDCGVSPGLSNLAIGRAAAQLAHVDEGVIYVGGLPSERFWPFEYRSVFSPTDVIEEYTRPARVIEGGKVVTRPALGNIEAVNVPGVGTLEAFDSDGLRSLLFTVKADAMREKTLRYPGHAERMRMLREAGFFGGEPIAIEGGGSAVPRRVTEALLFRAWKRPPGEAEFTVLRVVVRGRDANGAARTFRYDLLDRTDPKTGDSSMARTTGYPCSVVTRMIARGEYRDPGVKPLEFLARDAKLYAQLVEGLRAKGVQFAETVATG